MKPQSKLKSGRWPGLALAAFMAFTALAPHSGARASESLIWESFARSDLAYYVFNSTSEGRAIFEAVTALPARRARDLAELSAGLLKPEWRASLKPELEARLLRIQKRFLETHGGSSEFLNAADQRALAAIAREELGGLQLRPAAQYEFLNVAPAAEWVGSQVAGIAANDNASAGFLARAWHEGLSPRLGELAFRWTGQVEMIPAASWRGSQRAVLFVSTHGLARAEAERLVADTMELLAPATISFPTAWNDFIGKSPLPRMAVRLGNQLHDFRGKPTITAFGVPTRTLIDPVALIGLPERVRLSQYIEAHPLASALDGEARISPAVLDLFEAPSGSSLRQYLESRDSAYRAPLVIVWTPEPIAPIKARLIQN